jgi:hypothetical protein
MYIGKSIYIKYKSNYAGYLYGFLYAIILLYMAYYPSEYVLSIFVLATLLISLKYPSYSLLGILCSLSANEYYDKYTWLNSSLYVVFLVIFFKEYVGKIKTIVVEKYDSYLVIVFIYSFIISIINGFESPIVLLAFMFMIFIVRLMINNNIIFIHEIIAAFCVMFIFSGVIGLITNSFGLSHGVGSINRFISSYGDPNFYTLMGVVSIFGVYYYLKVNKIYKYAIIIIVLMLILITFSKMLIMLFFVNVLYLLYLYRYRLRFNNYFKNILFIVFLLFFVNILMDVLFHQNIINNYIYRFTEESTLGNNYDNINDVSSGRLSIQDIVLRHLFDQNILSLMFGNGYIGTKKYFNDINLGMITAHSVYMQILIDFGLIGAILYIILFVEGFKKSDNYTRIIIMNYYFVFLSLSWQYSIPYFIFYVILGKKFINIDSKICL